GGREYTCLDREAIQTRENSSRVDFYVRPRMSFLKAPDIVTRERRTYLPFLEIQCPRQVVCTDDPNQVSSVARRGARTNFEFHRFARSDCQRPCISQQGTPTT